MGPSRILYRSYAIAKKMTFEYPINTACAFSKSRVMWFAAQPIKIEELSEDSVQYLWSTSSNRYCAGAHPFFGEQLLWHSSLW